MRTLILLRGAPGAGKSTFVETTGLKDYTISTDDIRLLLGSPVLNINGEMRINQKTSKKAFTLLREMVENRMEDGELIVVDATHCSAKSFSWYKDLCNIYKYRALCIDFNVDRDILIERNKHRGIKNVDVEIIDRMLVNKANNPVPNWISTYDSEYFATHFAEIMGIHYADLSEYSNIYVIGDVHGCNSALQDLLHNTLEPNNFYIFLGDYIDRGIENEEVIRFLINNCDKKNLILLEGNHERHINRYVRGQKAVSEEFANITLPQLTHIEMNDLKRLQRKFAQVYAFIYNGQKFLCNHAGIPYVSWLENMIAAIPTEQFTKGVGTYDDLPLVKEQWEKNSPDITQICGHRNIQHYPINCNDKYITLEGQVEFGGMLRAISINKDGIAPIYIKNNKFKAEYAEAQIERDIGENRDADVKDTVELMRKSDLIKENTFKHISSFNFTRKVFANNLYNALTCKARGLFINTTTNKVVARGYDKFFNLGEESTSVDKITFPAKSYNKYNGYLGLIGYDEESDMLVYTSKSQIAPNGEHAELFKKVFTKCVSTENIERIKEICKTENLSLAFECVTKEDPHIVNYTEDFVVLLDAFDRTIKTNKLPYNELCFKFGNLVKVKECDAIIENYEQLVTYIDDVNNRNNVEGVVIEGANHFMIKLKCKYYKFWKFIRGACGVYNTHKMWPKISDETDDNYKDVYDDFKKWYEKEETLEPLIVIRDKYLRGM